MTLYFTELAEGVRTRQAGRGCSELLGGAGLQRKTGAWRPIAGHSQTPAAGARKRPREAAGIARAEDVADSNKYTHLISEHISSVQGLSDRPQCGSTR